MAAPSQREVKRLFALSGNRCAFPKCRAAIAEGKALVGEICHIKADKPGGPRYDPKQSEQERQAFENLMLMCANHHKVVDDDEEAYTVERLTKMKSEHESHSTPISQTSETDGVVKLLIENSLIVSGQSGGLAAHTVNAETISIHNAPNPSAQKTSETVDLLWQTVAHFKAKFTNVTLVDTIMLSEELDRYFSGRSDFEIADCLRELCDGMYVAQQLAALLPPGGDTHRLYVSPRLWAIYQVIIALLGRCAMLVSLSYKDRRLRDWREDELLDQHLRSVLPGPVVDAQKQARTGGISLILRLLDEAFLEEARKLRG